MWILAATTATTATHQPTITGRRSDVGEHTHALDSAHEHEGPHAGSAAAKSQRNLLIVLGLTTSYMLAEVIGGILTNSLALLADAGHMLTDVLGLAMALAAIRFAQRPATPAKTYGFY